MFKETEDFSNSFFILLYEDFSFKSFKIKNYIRNLPITSFLQNFIQKQDLVRAVIFLRHGTSVINLNLPHIKDIYFIRDKTEFLYDRTLMIDGNSFKQSKTNYHVYVNNPNHEYIESYNRTLPDSIKIKSSKIGFYGKISRHILDKNKFKKINSGLNIEEYKNLKKGEYIIWAGSKNFNRPNIINYLNKNSDVKIKCVEKYNLCEKRYIDILLENNGFCALSMDGSSVMCNRDTELGLSKIFNLKYTNFTGDASAANSIYIANNITEYLERIKQIKKDIEEENYSKLFLGEIYMNNLQIMRKQKFCNFFLIEVLIEAAGLKLNDLILNSSIINENLTSSSFLINFKKFLKQNESLEF